MSVLTLAPTPARHRPAWTRPGAGCWTPSPPGTTRPGRRRCGGTRVCCAPRPAWCCAATPTSTRPCSAPGCSCSATPTASTTRQCLPGWLSTTARREALAILRGQQRAIPSEDVADRVDPDETDIATALMDDELRRALRRGGGNPAPEPAPDRAGAAARAGVLRRPQPGTRHPAGQPRPAAGPRGPGPARPAGAQPALTARPISGRPWPFSATCAMPCRSASAIVRSGLASTTCLELAGQVVVELDGLVGIVVVRVDQRQLDRRHGCSSRETGLPYRATLTATAAACARFVTWSLCRTRDT